MRDVFNRGWGVDNHVVEKVFEVDVERGTKDVVDERLECRRGIGGPERADLVLVVAVAAAECSLVLIPLFNSQRVISVAEIDLGEDSDGVEAVQQLRYEG